MDFYAYLLSGMGFDIHKTSYFLVCNARRDEKNFNKTMKFDEYIIPYNWRINWIENRLDEMIELINQNEIPKPNSSCKNCAYCEQYANTIFGAKEVQSNLF